MAFKENNTNDNGIPANKQAVGFLNLYLPNTGGGRRKLGAIPLRQMYKNERELAAWLAEDPSRVLLILKKLEIEYNPVDTASGFDLTDAPAEGEKPADKPKK
jgi:hypothetical protein